MGWAETSGNLAWGIMLTSGHGELHESLVGGVLEGDTFQVEELIFVPAQGFTKPLPSILTHSADWKAWMTEAKPYNLIGLMSFGDGDSGLNNYMLYIRRTLTSWNLYDEHKPIDSEILSEPTGEEILALIQCADALGFTGDRTIGLYITASC